MPAFIPTFETIPDPRRDQTKLHKLIDILTIAVCAVICGAEGWEDIESFGQAKQEWLSTFLELPNGVPSHDTFRRVFLRINPKEFEKRFLLWVQSVVELTEGEVVHLDGKTSRGSRRGETPGIHMVSAWAAEARLVLGQLKTENHSNEITAIPELLQLLALKGCIVTIDAMGCQTAIANQIIEQQGDYVLALKGNHPTLHTAVEALFDQAQATKFTHLPHTFHQTVDADHGRIETRRAWATSQLESLDPNLRAAWKGLTSVVKVTATRDCKGQVSTESRSFLTSLPADAKHLLSVIRSHWGIENSLHWVLDVTFREDACRVKTGHGPENLTVLRHIALNLLKQETSLKKGVRAKRLRAGWDLQYLLKVVTS
ncbi:MAG: ISAs1 family transposase [Blastocatellia bacterium]|nr:ISAs1 family transposase [Blastocatellia bacterium]